MYVVKSALLIVLGVLILNIDKFTIEQCLLRLYNGPDNGQVLASSFSSMNTTGVTLARVQGDPTTCTNVIYTVNTYNPFQNQNQNHKKKKGKKNDDDDDGNEAKERKEQENIAKVVHAKSLRFLVRTSPILKDSTCVAFFVVDDPWMVTRSSKKGRSSKSYALHPVWGRLPATAIAMTTFVQAQYFLYLDSDALLVYPDITPATMYEQLRYDYEPNNIKSIHEHEQPQKTKHTPGLIVNKPFTGWLCGQCEQFHMGHGCFNSNVLLWYKSNTATQILNDWWKLRYSKAIHNMYVSKENTDEEKGNEDDRNDSNDKDNDDNVKEFFHGWSGTIKDRLKEKNGEANRLMYLFHTYSQEEKNDDENEIRIWPVPRKRSEDFNSESCPNSMDAGYTPCLQTDSSSTIRWNPDHNDDIDTDADADADHQQQQPSSCYIHQYSDDKELLFQHAAKIMEYTGSNDSDNDDE